MKKQTLAIAVMASMVPGLSFAADDTDIDMSNPTDVYTSVGVSYGNAGMNLKGQLMLSETKGDSGQKTGLIIEAKNIFNEGEERDKFSGGFTPVMVNGELRMAPNMEDEASERSYRLRYGTINTTNGTGWSIDAVLGDHSFYGDMAVIQAGPVMTIPVTENFYIFPILYMGAAIVEDNTEMLAEEPLTAINEDLVSVLDLRSSGIDVASLIMTGMVYARYTINDHWWVLGSARYTDAIQGKEWHDDVVDGGMQMASFESEVSLAYQINSHQNVRFNYKTDNSDSTDDTYWVEYNYAF